ncbi:MAG: phytoene desaturase, partial [Thermoleophilia bacterium]|nr:phytoene desaturase [Thermoleophilia bacterium]
MSTRFRTVDGRTDNVVVIGAGLAGLSAALHLAGAGRQVTVIDRRDDVGGLCGRLTSDGFSFDTGPTVLTMPSILDRSFAAVGESMSDRLQLSRLDPAYRAIYADGSSIDVGASLESTVSSVENTCGVTEAANFRRFADYCTRLYDAEYRSFIDRNFDSPFALLGRDLATLVSMGGFGSLAGKVAEYLRDPRTQRLTSFQALYAGMSPQSARALYAVITYMDVIGGVYFPGGGMHAIATAMADAARAAGVHFQLGTPVRRVVMSGRRARRVVTDDGAIDADAVIITADPRESMRNLLG